MLLWKMKTLSKQRAPCSVGAVGASVVCWPRWPRPGRSRVALRGVRPVAQRCGGWAVFGPACLQWASRQWSALRHSPFRPCFAFRCLPLECRNLPVSLCCKNVCQEHFESWFCSPELSTFSTLYWGEMKPMRPLFLRFCWTGGAELGLLVCAGETFGRVFTQAQGFVGCAESCALLGDHVPAGTAAVGRGHSGYRASVLFSPNLLQLVFFSSFWILL